MASILIDIFKTHDIYSGPGQYAYNFAHHMAELAPFRYELHFLGRHKHAFIKHSRHYFESANSLKRYFPGFTGKYDLWHSLHQYPLYLPTKQTRYILTIHDLNFLIDNRENNAGKTEKLLARLQRNIDRADAITVISNHTKKVVEESLDLKNKKVYTIHNGVELKHYPHPAQPSYVQAEKFFFTLGVIGPKKNFRTLVPLMHHFKDHQLIIAGNKSSDSARQIEAQIIDNNLQGRVILPGPISDEDKYWLYRNCDAFLFPSIAEGFGLPVIEAMLVGKPVFLSKRTSLPEIGGDVAYYFDNFEPESMVQFIREKLKHYGENEDSLREKIMTHAQKFTWDNCIKNFLEVYGEVLGG